MRALGFAGAVGIEIALLVTGGALGGRWLDERFATTPWLSLLGVGAAIAAAAFHAKLMLGRRPQGEP